MRWNRKKALLFNLLIKKQKKKIFYSLLNIEADEIICKTAENLVDFDIN